ncbi:hypothetical protein DPMN_147342 [Dreissena polymorpha]|uniref:Uncharacterized protein n=1 Tax=Dreissena polymorpha TaxID=45954 RepID=A0A9D4J0J7_DREPO|nr:hypothetical protein DPMN_147342 [Dreissena polymorpha]
MISDHKAIDDSPCLLKAEVEEEVRSLKAEKSPRVNNFPSELIICEYDPKERNFGSYTFSLSYRVIGFPLPIRSTRSSPTKRSGTGLVRSA